MTNLLLLLDQMVLVRHLGLSILVNLVFLDVQDGLNHLSFLQRAFSIIKTTVIFSNITW